MKINNNLLVSRLFAEAISPKGYFIEGIFAERTFRRSHFTEWTSYRMDILPNDISRYFIVFMLNSSVRFDSSHVTMISFYFHEE
ncbi:unnamed protein product [Rhizophagus irregularis]|nr:unnamed protein product [Rhizophagus irregularis]